MVHTNKECAAIEGSSERLQREREGKREEKREERLSAWRPEAWKRRGCMREDKTKEGGRERERWG
jgi:hypothetical protein